MEPRYTNAMRKTQKDIASDLGISLVTVSRALNGKGYVSDEMKRRIFDYARQTNYVPHRASQVLVRNKTRRLALFSSSLPSYFWDEIRKGVSTAGNYLQAFDFDVQYYCIPDLDTEAYIRRLRSELRKGLDALALVNQPIYDMDSIYALVKKSGIPYVTFNVDAPGRRGLCYIGADYVAGGRLAAEVIGTALRFCSAPVALVIADDVVKEPNAANVDLNADRLVGFLDVMNARFPGIRCDVQYLRPNLRMNRGNDAIDKLLKANKGRVNAVYLIPALNARFLEALEKSDYRETVNIVHDLDQSALHYLDNHLLSAVIYQDPFLQGYYTVKTLEHIVESGIREPMKTIEIASNAVFAENKAAMCNHFDFIE